MDGQWENFEKKVDLFFLKSDDYFFSNFSHWSHTWNFYSSFGTPKEARKTGQSVTLAKVSPAKESLAKMSLRPKCLWPKCHWPKGHSGQSVILAKVSRPKCLWPKCHSGQSVIQPVNLSLLVQCTICTFENKL